MEQEGRELLLMRHAEAGARPGVGDHERPLTVRGCRAAGLVGRALQSQGPPDFIASSSALRALTTARIVAGTLEREPPVLLLAELYLAGPLESMLVPLEHAHEHRSILIVGHNPGLEELVELLTCRRSALLPAELVRIALPIEDWSELGPAVRGKVTLHFRPPAG